MHRCLRSFIAFAALTASAVTSQAQVAAEAPWARPTVAGQQGGGGFLVLRNSGASADRLVGGSTPLAERFELLELKGKLAPDLGSPASVVNDAQADIVQALVALGYSEREAAAAIKALPADVAVAEGIKLALKALSK